MPDKIDAGSLIRAARRINQLSGDILPGTLGVVQWADHTRNEACVVFVGHGQRWVNAEALEAVGVVEVTAK